jgi:Na+-transporting methylmalonyl-CoA/oxaloacetate decarboxylase gamma subunit
VLLIGTMRYAFVAAARVLPWLNAALPHSMARKTVAALQGIVLLVAGAGIMPLEGNAAAVLLALASLVWSFGRDITWLYRHRHPVQEQEQAPEPEQAQAQAQAQDSVRELVEA